MSKTQQVTFDVETFNISDVLRSSAGITAVITCLYSAVAAKCCSCKGSPTAAAACTDQTCPLVQFGPQTIFELPAILEPQAEQSEQ